MITSAGRTFTRNLMIGSQTAGITHFATGSNATATLVSMTSLVSEQFRDDTYGSKEDIGEIRFNGFVPAQYEGTIGEFGLFTNATSGTMFLRYADTSGLINNTSTKEYSIRITVEVD